MIGFNPSAAAAETRPRSAPKYCSGSLSIRAGCIRIARSYSGQLRIVACETRTFGPRAWRTCPCSSPSSARTSRTSAALHAASRSAAPASPTPPGSLPRPGCPAYATQCAICQLKELRLLDAAHILGDVEGGEPAVSNGLSLCAIHHRAFDQNLVGVSPDYVVHVSRRLREDDDGPMLDLLKGFHELPLHVPTRAADRPDQERLGARFARFLSLAA